MEDIRNYAWIGEHEILVARLKLRDWLRLEDIHADIFDAAEAKNGEQLIHLLYSYVSAASSIPVEELQSRPWFEITKVYALFYKVNIPNLDFPFLRKRKEKPSIIQKEDGWEYEGRGWYMWAHMLAQAYGWNLEYIANMDVDDALALIQEIEVQNQLEREWQWGLSDKSVSYNSETRIAKFVPLHRPEWMEASSKANEIPKVKLKSSEMPMGVILSWDNGKSSQSQ